jgi:hypothetical protein
MGTENTLTKTLRILAIHFSNCFSLNGDCVKGSNSGMNQNNRGEGHPREDPFLPLLVPLSRYLWTTVKKAHLCPCSSELII